MVIFIPVSLKPIMIICAETSRGAFAIQPLRRGSSPDQVLGTAIGMK
jgi:hypothetical protein